MRMWGRRATGAQFAAISQIAWRLGGEAVPLQALHAAYVRSWEAGCDNGPDAVAAMPAWAA